MTQRLSAHYLGDKGEKYAVRHVPPHALGYLLNFEFFRPYLGASSVVLDFGCGNGGMLRLIEQFVARAEGLEINPASAIVAEETGCVIYRRLEELPLIPTYDVIVSNHVLEHVRDVCSTLERLRVCLKVGGLFIAKLPHDDLRSRYQRRWSAHDLDHHLHTWTPRLFANVLSESGYGVRECRMITFAWDPRLYFLLRTPFRMNR